MRLFSYLGPVVLLALSDCPTKAPEPPTPTQTMALRPLDTPRILPRPAPPPALQPAGVGPYFFVHAKGTQSYACAFGDGGAAWSKATPEAVLYYPNSETVFGKHLLKPLEGPTWQEGEKGEFVGSLAPSDGFASVPSLEDAGVDLPWLVIPRKGGSDGGMLARAKFIQRVETFGGLATNQPLACDAAAADAGLVVKVPYAAKYVLLGDLPKPQVDLTDAGRCP